jgi:hemerythrin
MPIRWTPALSVGVADIDEQHQELFRRAGRLVQAVKDGHPEEQVGELVDFLHAYAVWHFGLEEEWMRRSEYPGYERHKAEHDRFASDLLQLARDHERQGPTAFLARRVDAWLEGWLRQHVSGTDAELGRFLQRRAG